MALQIRRGTDAQRALSQFASGELIFTTDTQQLWVGTGAGGEEGQGGVNVVKNTAGAGMVWNSSTNALDLNPASWAQDLSISTDHIPPTSNRRYYTDELAKAAAGALLQNGNNTGISFSYNPSNGILSATVVGSASVVGDPSPHLGGDLVLNGHNIGGTGNININGSVTATSISGNLGANLGLASHDIVGSGNINISGNITGTTISASLGSNLGLNSYTINGNGSISITGGISASSINATTVTLGAGGPSIVAATANNISLGTIGNPLQSLNFYTQVDDIVPVKVRGITKTFAGSFQGPFTERQASRGSIASPTAIGDGDIIGGDIYVGYTGNAGTGFSLAGVQGIAHESGGSISSGSSFLPGYWFVSVSDGSHLDLNNKLLSFHSNGALKSPIFQAIPRSSTDITGITPSEGMIVFDTTLKKFLGYDGTSWAPLN